MGRGPSMADAASAASMDPYRRAGLEGEPELRAGRGRGDGRHHQLDRRGYPGEGDGQERGQAWQHAPAAPHREAPSPFDAGRGAVGLETLSLEEEPRHLRARLEVHLEAS